MIPFLSPHEKRGATRGLALTSSLALLPLLLSPSLPASLSTVPINQSPFLTFHLSSPASYRGPETKQAPIIAPPQPTHPPTLQLPTGPGWLIFPRRSVSNRPPWCQQTKRGLPNSPFLSFTLTHPHPFTTPPTYILHPQGPRTSGKALKRGNTPSQLLPSIPLVPPHRSKKKKKKNLHHQGCQGGPSFSPPFVGSCVPRFTYPRTLASTPPSSSWKTDLLKNVVFSSFLFSLSGWLVMCPVLLPVSMVPLDDNLAGETAIFNQTLIYCAAPLLAWLWLKEWVGCCVAFCSLFCWGVWLTLIACSYSPSLQRPPVALSFAWRKSPCIL